MIVVIYVSTITVVFIGSLYTVYFLRWCVARASGWYWYNINKTTFWPSLVQKSPSKIDWLLGWAARPRTRGTIKFFVALNIASIVGSLWFGWITAGIVLGIFLSLLIAIVIQRAFWQQKKFVEALPDATGVLVDLLRAGYSLPQAIAALATKNQTPVAPVFAALARAEEWRLELNDALENIQNHIQIPDWNIISDALKMHYVLGGNSIPLIEESINTLRDQYTIARDVQTATASGRLSGHMVAALVPVVIICFWLLSPAYITILFATAVGRMLLTVAGILELVGFIWIKKIIAIRY